MTTETFVSTKKFIGFPCTHRQWKTAGHCRFVHGYSRDFYIEFRCRERTKEGYVMDFAALKEVKSWLEYMFDHTFLAAEDDPYMETWKRLDKEEQIQLRTLPDVGMEGTAKFVYNNVSQLIYKQERGRVWICRVEVIENEKNSAYYIPRCIDTNNIKS